MMNLLPRFQGFRDHVRIFSSPEDVFRYRRIRYGRETGESAFLRVRQTGGTSLMVRPRTTDSEVLWDTFHHQYHLPPKDLPIEGVILDLGANVGYTAAHFAHLYPRARIIAVEMDDGNVEAAKRNLAPFAQCSLMHAAVWSTNGEVRYDPGVNEWAFRVLAADQDPGKKMRPVRARTLASILDEYRVGRVDFLKMDIEGAEADVLENCGEWCDRVRCMKVELHPQFNPRSTFDSIAGVLSAKGFTCIKDTHHWDALLALRSG